MRITNGVPFLRTWAVAAVLVAAMLGQPSTARADIIDDWATLALPAAPQPKPVALDAKTTALLVFDFLPANCGNPRCAAAMAKVRPLLDAARTAKALVVYGEFPPNSMTSILPAVAPLGSEPNVIGVANRFINTNLDQILKDHGIKTVIMVGAAANGVVLYTASDAAMRGYKVVVPVDGMAGNSPFAEGYSALQLASGPTVGQNVTLTRCATISFQ
jgi:hypothetical protein